MQTRGLSYAFHSRASNHRVPGPRCNIFLSPFPFPTDFSQATLFLSLCRLFLRRSPSPRFFPFSFSFFFLLFAPRKPVAEDSSHVVSQTGCRPFRNAFTRDGPNTDEATETTSEPKQVVDKETT